MVGGILVALLCLAATTASKAAAADADPAPAKDLGASAEGEASDEPEGAAARKKGKIGRFLELRIWDDWMRLTVDKVRGTIPPFDEEAANRIEYRARHTTASLALRIEAGPLVAAYLRAGALRASLHNTIRLDTDLPILPVGSKVNESTEADLGVEFGLGIEIHLPAHELVNIGLFYEIAYGEADVERETFYQTVVEGDYRYLTHRFLFFGEVPLRVKKPFRGLVIPRIDVGALLMRVMADFTAPDGSRDWDIDWIADQAFLLAASIRVELDEGFYFLLRGEFIGRGGYLLAVGIRF